MFLVRELLAEIKSTFRDRDVIILLLGGPIFLTLLFGGVYLHNYLEDIPAAVLDEDNSSISRMIIQQFDENERFDVRFHAGSKEELKNYIDSRKAHMGIYIPHGFSKKISEMKSAEVLIFVDGTNMIIGNNSYAKAAEIVQTVSAGIQMKILQAKGLMPQTAEDMALVFNFNDRILYDPRMTYMNYLLLGFVAVFLQQVMLSGVGFTLIKNSQSLANENSFIKVFKKIIIKILACALFGLISTSAAIGIAGYVFKVPIRGSFLNVILLCVVFVFAISCPAILLASILKERLKFSQVSFMLSLPAFVSCGYVWPQDQMPGLLTLLIKIFWPLIYFARPFAELIFKGIPFEAVTTNLIQMIIYILFWMPTSILIFYKRTR
ncbi:MAG: type transport system permease protein [Thermosediminibacterales bacterium]|nr:type transport system permease protein [Thermosediminibacterales bacterium]